MINFNGNENDKQDINRPTRRHKDKYTKYSLSW